MKTLITFLVCGLAIAGPAQTSLKTFTSADGVFRFQYSDVLVNACTSEQTPGNPASCKSQSTICDGPGSEGITLACFSYPNERFKNKPSFVGADFYVSEIQSATTEQVCLRGSPNWYVISSKPGLLQSTTLASRLLRSATTGQVTANPGLHIERFTMESVMSWAFKPSFHEQNTIPERSKNSPRKTHPKWRVA
jgi:hypothetical protein